MFRTIGGTRFSFQHSHFNAIKSSKPGLQPRPFLHGCAAKQFRGQQSDCYEACFNVYPEQHCLACWITPPESRVWPRDHIRQIEANETSNDIMDWAAFRTTHLFLASSEHRAFGKSCGTSRKGKTSMQPLLELPSPRFRAYARTGLRGFQKASL